MFFFFPIIIVLHFYYYCINIEFLNPNNYNLLPNNQNKSPVAIISSASKIASRGDNIHCLSCFIVVKYIVQGGMGCQTFVRQLKWYSSLVFSVVLIIPWRTAWMVMQLLQTEGLREGFSSGGLPSQFWPDGFSKLQCGWFFLSGWLWFFFILVLLWWEHFWNGSMLQTHHFMDSSVGTSNALIIYIFICILSRKILNYSDWYFTFCFENPASFLWMFGAHVLILAILAAIYVMAFPTEYQKYDLNIPYNSSKNLDLPPSISTHK